MTEVIFEAFLESIILLPILFLMYLFIEYFERKRGDRFYRMLLKSRKAGPVYGSVLGLLPQCGFAAILADLYAHRYVTIGTVLAVFLATSDEAFPILLTQPDRFGDILVLIVIKLITAVVFGYALDFIFRKRKLRTGPLEEHSHNARHAHDGCRDNCVQTSHIAKSAFCHGFKVFIIILAANIILNMIINFIGEEALEALLMSGSVWQTFAAGLVGLIPNCSASVVLVNLYIKETISFGAMTAGLLSGAGVGVLVLLQAVKNKKDCLIIIAVLYCVSVFAGSLINVFYA